MNRFLEAAHKTQTARAGLIELQTCVIAKERALCAVFRSQFYTTENGFHRSTTNGALISYDGPEGRTTVSGETRSQGVLPAFRDGSVLLAGTSWGLERHAGQLAPNQTWDLSFDGAWAEFALTPNGAGRRSLLPTGESHWLSRGGTRGKIRWGSLEWDLAGATSFLSMTTGSTHFRSWRRLSATDFVSNSGEPASVEMLLLSGQQRSLGVFDRTHTRLVLRWNDETLDFPSWQALTRVEFQSSSVTQLSWSFQRLTTRVEIEVTTSPTLAQGYVSKDPGGFLLQRFEQLRLPVTVTLVRNDKIIGRLTSHQTHLEIGNRKSPGA